jgi:predicted nucleic acid-binding protein
VLYLDSSALIKIYFSEVGSARLEAALKQASDAGVRVFSSVLAYAEVHAAVARKSREERLSESRAATIHVLAMSPVEASIGVLGFVRDILKSSPIRGADALHLASALWLRDASRLGSKPGSLAQSLTFVCSDRRLLDAAETQKLLVFDPEKG